MPQDSPFGEERKGLFARLRSALAPAASSAHTRRVVRQERLDVQVPAENAETVRGAIEEWLRGYGVQTALTSEPAADGKMRLHADLDAEAAKKLDLSSDAVQAELQKLLLGTLKTG
jgi:hypothetical protein